MKALDTSKKTTGKALSIKAQGFEAVGIYLRSDRCSAAMVAELKAAGLKIWSCYEKGFPTTAGYFTRAKGGSDGAAAVAFAKHTLNQPAGSLIYATVDFDPDHDPHHDDPNGPTIRGAISDYMTAFKAAVEPAGYGTGVYGSGRTCRILIASGLAASGWLCVSSSFAEHKQFKPSAAIVQDGVIDEDWDSDNVQNLAAAGLW
jgi:Domain of unknown function (DUF1906)